MGEERETSEVTSDLDNDLASLASLYHESPDDTDTSSEEPVDQNANDSPTDAGEREPDTEDADANAGEDKPADDADDDVLKAFQQSTDLEPEQNQTPVPAASPPPVPQLTPEQMAEIREFEQWKAEKAAAAKQQQQAQIPVPEITEDDFTEAFNDTAGMRNLLLKNNQTVMQTVGQMVEAYLQHAQAQNVLQNEYMVLLSLAAEKEPHLYEHPEAMEAALRKHIAPGKDPRVVVTNAISTYNKNYGVFKKMATSQKQKQFDVAPQGKPQSGNTRTRPANKQKEDPDPFGFRALFQAYPTSEIE